MTDRVDASVHRLEDAALEPPLDRSRTDPKAQQLSPRDDAVLLLSEFGYRPIDLEPTPRRYRTIDLELAPSSTSCGANGARFRHGIACSKPSRDACVV